MLAEPRSPRRRRQLLSCGLLTLSALGLGVTAAIAGPAAAQAPPSTSKVVEAEAGALALEPIGGYTELANVRIITTELCPAQSTSLIARITGGGFKPDSNVFGNTDLSLVQKMPNGSGYVAPIFADWDYLASAHEAKIPLEGLAKITLLCADSDLERIDARMEGAVRFESEPGERTTFLQEGGPRIASGLPGVPEPGMGGVPKDAPTAAPVGGVVTTDSESDVPASQPGDAVGGSDSLSGDSDSSESAAADDRRLTAANGDGSGPPTGLIALGSIGVLVAAGVGYVFTRRPNSGGLPGSERP